MSNFAKRLVWVAFLAGVTAPVHAADIYEPMPVEPAPVIEPVVETQYNGWYIRGDVDYHWSDLRGIEYITYGCGTGCGPGTNRFDFGDVDESWSLGGGIGYQINNYLRTDITGDYFFDADFRGQTSDLTSVSVDRSSYSAFLLLANAYADLGTYGGFTPYVGAGLGGAYVKWDNLRNTIEPGIDNLHKGARNWRFAWALMVGGSYCLTDKIALDGGYRFSRIEGGRMFEERSPGGVSLGAGPGFDRGLEVHEVRAGLRYNFGGNRHCAQPEAVAFEPPPEPVVYKQ